MKNLLNTAYAAVANAFWTARFAVEDAYFAARKAVAEAFRPEDMTDLRDARDELVSRADALIDRMADRNAFLRDLAFDLELELAGVREQMKRNARSAYDAAVFADSIEDF